MSDPDEDRAEAKASMESLRSHCMFERDRALPRPTAGRPIMTDLRSARPPRATIPLATKIGFALWGISLLWWFAYYAN